MTTILYHRIDNPSKVLTKNFENQTTCNDWSNVQPIVVLQVISDGYTVYDREIFDREIADKKKGLSNVS